MPAATLAPKQARGSQQPQLEHASLNSVDRIGQTAGQVWQLLSVDGPLSITRIVRDLKNGEVSRDVIMQALGWLAREDKIWIDDETRSKQVSLKF